MNKTISVMRSAKSAGLNGDGAMGKRNRIRKSIDNRSPTYGKVAAGIAAVITDKVSATVNAVCTFARADGNDFGVNGGLKVTF
jgi:hypothetical protein